MLGMVVVHLFILAATVRYYIVYKVKRGLTVYLYTLITKTLTNVILAIEIELSFYAGSSPSV